MKQKKKAPPRRISFAVDREEIEINSDWVEAVMGTPSPVPPFPSPMAPEDDQPTPFFVPEINIATDAESATGDVCAAVATSTPADDFASAEEIATVENNECVEFIASKNGGELIATVEQYAPVEDHEQATEVQNTTVEASSCEQQVRTVRPRPLRRITDGLTPGQFAVYSLMYGAGETAGDGENRIYKGGYADLVRLTGMSKRGIQNVVAELQTKRVLAIHQSPGYHRTETTAYLVPSAEAVLQAWRANDWSHAAGKSKTLIR